MRAALILFILYFIFSPLSATAENATILINEVAWMGTTASVNDEWIELYNASDNAIDVTGWRLQTADGGLVAELTGSIAANGYYLLERTDDDTVQHVTAEVIYTGSLSNTGEVLELTNADGATVDQLDASTGWPGGDNTTKQTLERAHGAWQTSTEIGGTPKAQNSAPAPATDAQPNDESPAATSTPITAPTEKTNATANPKRDEIVFTEAFPNPIGPDNDEFIEIGNKSVRSIDLTGWIIETSGGQRFELPSLTMFPGSIVTFYRSTTNLALRNNKEKITLAAPGQKTISSIEWKKPAPEGRSFQRARDDSYDWALPTPGYHAAIEPIIAPTATITGPLRAAVGDIVTFDGSDSFDPLNRPLTLRWQFGDGRIAYGPTARQLFTAAGKYEISLTASVDEEASSTELINITVVSNATTSPATVATTTAEVVDSIFSEPFTLANIIISEFLPNPNGSDSQEFIELFNADSETADIGGWLLDDTNGGSRPFSIPSKTYLLPGQYRAFFKTETKLSLNNDHDEVRLLLPDGEAFDVATYEDVKEGASYVRTEDNDWQQTNAPTPNELNALTAMPNGPATTTTALNPSILGAETAVQIEAPADNHMLRYMVSGAAILAVLGIAFGAKKRQP